MKALNLQLRDTAQTLLGRRKFQGLTKTWLKRGQMALGVFPNCYECQKIDFPVLKKSLRIFTS